MTNKLILGLVLIIFLIGGGVFIFSRSSQDSGTPANNSTAESQVESNIDPNDSDLEKYTWEIKEVAQGLEVPWDMALASNGRIFITERPGRVQVMEKDYSLKQVASLPQVASIGESGLTGITLHPDFDKNNKLYLYYTYRLSGGIGNRVSQFSLINDQLSDEKIILDNLPGGSIHNGGRLRFGPDKKLYVLTGDAARPTLAQDLNSNAGKVLRMNDDGSTPSDNPYPNSLVYSYGHRNPQGLDWHPLTEELIASEHGETVHDEINLIKPKGNYAWPDDKLCSSKDPKYTQPILCSNNDSWAPSGGAFLGKSIWRFRYSFFFAGLRGMMLERVDIVEGQVRERENIIKNTYGRLRAVLPDGEGNLYVSTSNRDGRNLVMSGDDKILKLTPKKIE